MTQNFYCHVLWNHVQIQNLFTEGLHFTLLLGELLCSEAKYSWTPHPIHSHSFLSASGSTRYKNKTRRVKEAQSLYGWPKKTCRHKKFTGSIVVLETKVQVTLKKKKVKRFPKK